MAPKSGFCLFETALGACGIAWNERALLGVQLPEGDEASGTGAHAQPLSAPA